MHRSSSASRVSDEFFSGLATSSGRLSLPGGQRSLLERDQLPRFNPLSDVAKKESSRFRSAENAIHFIPLVLLLCGIVLWLFSSPHIVTMHEDALVIDGVKNVAVDGQERGTIPLELGDLNEAKQYARSRTKRSLLSSEET